MTLIIGIVTEIAIFYLSEFQSMPEDAPLAERLLRTSRHRMRPIVMSALAAMLTLLPPALAIGAGAQLQQSPGGGDHLGTARRGATGAVGHTGTLRVNQLSGRFATMSATLISNKVESRTRAPDYPYHP